VKAANGRRRRREARGTASVRAVPHAASWWQRGARGVVSAAWGAPACVFLVALVIRLLDVWQLAASPAFAHLSGDSRGYDEWAQRLAAGNWLGTGVFYQAPLYPYILALLYRALGRNLLYVRLVQAALGALSCGILTAAGTRWFGRRAGPVGGLMLAAYAPAIFFDSLIQKSVLDGLLVSLLLLALGGRCGSMGRRAGLAGGLLGLLALNRENALALLPVVALAVAAASQPTRRWRAALLTVAATAAVLAPVGVRNLVVGGEFHLTTSQLGPNFYIGNHPDATGKYEALRPDHGSVRFEQQDATALAEEAAGRPLRPSEVSRYWLERGLAWIGRDPGAWCRLTGRKLLLLVNRTETADTEDIGTHAETSKVLSLSATLVHFGLLAPLAGLGMWLTRRRWRELWPLYALGGVLAASVLVFYVMDRYRYPLVPVLVLFAGGGIAKAASSWRTRARSERWTSLAVLVAAIAVCNWPLQRAEDMRAVTHYNVGVALGEDGLVDQAESEYRAAVAIQPALAGPHTNLAALLATRGAYIEALSESREAVRLAPASSSAHVNLGVALAGFGDTPGAVRALTEAVRLDGRNADAHYNLGRAYEEMNRAEAAVEQFREVIRLEPSRSAAYNNLGVLLCTQGQLTEGILHLRKAVELDASSHEAAANLEHALRLAAGPQ
jgi:tetratricopeptide (TPR) repeat protein